MHRHEQRIELGNNELGQRNSELDKLKLERSADRMLWRALGRLKLERSADRMLRQALGTVNCEGSAERMLRQALAELKSELGRRKSEPRPNREDAMRH